MKNPTGKRNNAQADEAEKEPEAAEPPATPLNGREFADADAWFLNKLNGELGPALIAALTSEQTAEESVRDEDLPPQGRDVVGAIARIMHRLSHGDENRDRTEAPCDPTAVVVSGGVDVGVGQHVELGELRPLYGDGTPPAGEPRGPALSWSIELSAEIRRVLSWAGRWVHVSQGHAVHGLASYTLSVDTRPARIRKGALRVTVHPEADEPIDVVLTPATPVRTLDGLSAEWRTIRLALGARTSAENALSALSSAPWDPPLDPGLAGENPLRAYRLADPPGSTRILGLGAAGYPPLDLQGGSDHVRGPFVGAGATYELTPKFSEDARIEELLGHAVAYLVKLLRERGVHERTPVGVLTRYRGYAPCPVQAVRELGAEYVPLDPDVGAAGLASLLSATAPLLVLAEEGLTDRLPANGPPVVILDACLSALTSLPTEPPAPPRVSPKWYLGCGDLGRSYDYGPPVGWGWADPDSYGGSRGSQMFFAGHHTCWELGSAYDPPDGMEREEMHPSLAALAAELGWPSCPPFEARAGVSQVPPGLAIDFGTSSSRYVHTRCAMGGWRRERGHIPDPSRRLAPPSVAQERLWLRHRNEPDSARGNVSFSVALGGALDADALGRALGELVRRHEVLRSTFRDDGDGLHLVIHPAPGRLDPRVVDLCGAARDDVKRRLEDEAARPFDPRGQLPVRALLVRTGQTEHTLAVTVHPAAADEWSAGTLFHDLCTVYGEYRAGSASPLSAPEVRYADFAAWQRRALEERVLEPRLAYWRDRLRGAPAVLELPHDRPRPAPAGRRPAVRHFDLPALLAARVRSLARELDATLAEVVLSACSLLLHRLTGSDDVVVGTRVAGRVRGLPPGAVGCYADTLPLRADLSGDPSFRTLVQRVAGEVREARANEGVPFESIVEAVRPERTPGRHPLFQVAVAVREVPAPVRLPGLSLRLAEVHGGAPGLDLFLEVQDDRERLRGRLHYAPDLWEPDTADRMIHLFRRVLDAGALHPDRPAAAAPLVVDAERHVLLEHWSGTVRPYPREATIHEVFAQVAHRHPSRTALSWDGGQMTYGELHARSLAVAARLRGLGVRADEPVALVMQRSPQLVAGILGILHAGGAYVPIDAEYPHERVSWMLADCAARVAVTQERLAAVVPAGVEVVRIEEAWDSRPVQAGPGGSAGAGPEGAAYVIYTSGSTGRPKGVVVPHRAVLRLVRDADYARFGVEETWLQVAPVSFDASTLELWAPLLNGGCLAIYPPEQPIAEALMSFVTRHHVTSAWLTAGLFRRLVHDKVDVLGGLTQLLAGGDVLSISHVREVLERYPRLRLINGYGPTENTTFSCCHAVTLADVERGSIPIGRPIANSTAYVLDARMNPVPVDVPGELYVGGDGVARGYLRAPALTAERYLPDPFSASPGARLYRTGDRARWRSDGTLEFLGRIDQQAKIRGYRVEPGEIEAALLRHSAVADAVVQVREDVPGERRLVAYVKPASMATSHGTRLAAEIRDALEQELPAYLIPSAIVPLEKLPLTASGKVDHAALPAPRSPRSGTEPRTYVEGVLATIWKEVLGQEVVYLDDDFFELGGDSILAMRIVARVREMLKLSLPVPTLLEARTPAQLAKRIERAQPEVKKEVLAAMAATTEPVLPLPVWNLTEWRETV
ncbi:amino acid adenylation domain-containing protein [Longimicrobium sp.]|uniref:amino acid adenylation domain-containing protein n=1 Tax=Longimicrobium sp. TaxID=2029185 RepID=UPI003B3A5AC8